MLFVVSHVGCTCINADPLIPETTTTTTTTTEDLGPCGMDCAEIQSPPCTVAVCNVGQVVGPVNTCVVVSAAQGVPCDDGKFCTVNDSCDSGVCVGVGKNICGILASPCEAVTCYEDSETCDVSPVNDGTECTPTELCKVNGVCHLGECLGEPKDCSFSPLNECNKVGCDPDTGKCVGVADPNKDDAPCLLTGELCTVNKTCKAGACQGGVPKDCSALDSGCSVGACNAASGICQPQDAPVGTVCNEGLHECDVGKCDDKGTCVASAAPNGIACNDHDACTKSDSCSAGVCGGTPVAGCSHYLKVGFEACPDAWTLAGDWECGTPEDFGPTEAHTGVGVIATQVDGLYHVSQSFTTTVADSPPIDLTGATNPMVSFWAWVHTEGGSYDGWNLKVSTNGGATFKAVTNVTPPYDLTISSQKAWGGDHSDEGWQLYTADLTEQAGSTVVLRFAFRSDGATVFPGVYIDDLVVSEPQESPLFITTQSPLETAFVDMAYSAPLQKLGGGPGSVWTIVPGGVNDEWLTIDAATGALGGTPLLANVGPVTVKVHVQEALLPSNFADATLTFEVKQAAYYTSFEGACPNGWTLTGDWECGVPSGAGPGSAFVGAQCLATKLAGNYSNLQTFAATTATSPDINLAGVSTPNLSFRMWVDTEGSTFDGVTLMISNDGGVNYSVLDTATPAFTLTIGGKPAWGGHQAALGWQAIEADLGAFADQTVRFRFAFQSDSSGIYPGVYIDDVLVN